MFHFMLPAAPLSPAQMFWFLTFFSSLAQIIVFFSFVFKEILSFHLNYLFSFQLNNGFQKNDSPLWQQKCSYLTNVDAKLDIRS